MNHFEHWIVVGLIALAIGAAMTMWVAAHKYRRTTVLVVIAMAVVHLFPMLGPEGFSNSEQRLMDAVPHIVFATAYLVGIGVAGLFRRS